jgi:hypothetical protein
LLHHPLLCSHSSDKLSNQTRAGLYEHPCISAVINESYFVHDKTEGAVHFASFMPQMPIPTVCFTVIAVNSAYCFFLINQSHAISSRSRLRYPSIPPELASKLNFQRRLGCATTKLKSLTGSFGQTKMTLTLKHHDTY